VRKYWLFFKSQIAVATTYRIDLYGRWVISLFGVVLYVALWSVTSKDQGELFKLIAYFSLFYGVLNNMHSGRVALWIAEAINSGSLNNFLIKPINFPLLQVIRGLTLAMIRIAVPVVILIGGCVFFPHIFAPLSLVNFLAFLLFSVLGLVIWNVLIVSLSTIAFAGTEINSTMTVLDLVIALLKGAYIPATLFPLWATKGLSLTFIPYLASYPIKLYQEPIVWNDFLFSLGIALGWVGIFSFTAAYFYKRGLRNYEAAGA